MQWKRKPYLDKIFFVRRFFDETVNLQIFFQGILTILLLWLMP